ncbi:hypothetical protein REPUB_Repub16aG0137700 [Reevesia pubescens]
MDGERNNSNDNIDRLDRGSRGDNRRFREDDYGKQRMNNMQKFKGPRKDGGFGDRRHGKSHEYSMEMDDPSEFKNSRRVIESLHSRNKTPNKNQDSTDQKEIGGLFIPKKPSPSLHDHIIPVPCLPDHIIVDILSRLPAEFVLEYRTVCKLWKALTTTTKFIDLHLKQSSPSLIYQFTLYNANRGYSDRVVQNELCPVEEWINGSSKNSDLEFKDTLESKLLSLFGTLSHKKH